MNMNSATPISELLFETPTAKVYKLSKFHFEQAYKELAKSFMYDNLPLKALKDNYGMTIESLTEYFKELVLQRMEEG